MQLKPASAAECGVYQPYYAVAKRPFLPLAVGLFQQGSFEGKRLIEGDAPVSFVASWMVTSLPADLTNCSVQFSQDADLSYTLTLASHELVEYLIDVIVTIRKGSPADFSTSFYKKLMRYED